MNDLRRWCDEDASDLERLLLDAGADEPPPAARSKLLQRLGVAAAASTMTAATIPAAAGKSAGVGAGATATGASSAVTATSVQVVAKWVTIGLLAGGATSAGAIAVSDQASPPGATAVAPARDPSGTAAATAAAARKSAPAASPDLPAEPPAPRAQATPIADADSRPKPLPKASRPRPQTAPPPAPGGDAEPRLQFGVSEEIAVLDRARAALARGDANRALDALRERQQRFGQGALGPEADVLQAEALLRLGRMGAARRLVQRFLKTYPQSPHAARMRSLLDRSDRALSDH